MYRAPAAAAPVRERIGLDDEQSLRVFHHGFPSPLACWHHHDEYELHLIVNSTGTMFAGDHVGAFEPGQLFLMGPCLPHNWVSRTRPGETIEVRDYVAHVRRDLLTSLAAGAPELRELTPLLDRARFGIRFDGRARRGAEAWFRRAERATGSRRVVLLLELLTRLAAESDYRLLSTMPVRSESDSNGLERIDEVTRHVLADCSQDISLATVSSMVRMSESAFSRFFAKSTGVTFSDFLNRARVSKACELLASTERQITAICYDVGFRNVANFNRRFLQLKSMTPSEYRRRARSWRSGTVSETRGDGWA